MGSIHEKNLKKISDTATFKEQAHEIKEGQKGFFNLSSVGAKKAPNTVLCWPFSFHKSGPRMPQILSYADRFPSIYPGQECPISFPILTVFLRYSQTKNAPYPFLC